jgi:hypothetical protein
MKPLNQEMRGMTINGERCTYPDFPEWDWLYYYVRIELTNIFLDLESVGEDISHFLYGVLRDYETT